MGVETLENKLDLILRKLEKIEEILYIDEDEPLEDELLTIKRYLDRKKNGGLELIPLEEALNEI